MTIKQIIQDMFNNREIAFTLWISIFAILVMFNFEIRKAFIRTIKIFIDSKIVIINMIMLFYILVLVIILKSIKLWSIKHVPLTAVWIILVAYVMLINYENVEKPDYLKKWLKDNLKAIVFIEFIINLYVFELWIEIIITPFLFVIGGMLAVSDTDKKYEIVKKILNYIFILIGAIFISYSFYMIISDFKNFATVDNLENFYLPLLLSFLFIPFVYVFALYCTYEIFFIRLKYFVREKKLLRYLKIQTLYRINLNIEKLNRWTKYIYTTWDFKEKQEVNEAFRLFKIINKRTKNNNSSN